MKLVVEIEVNRNLTDNTPTPVHTYTDLGCLLEQLGSDLKNSLGTVLPRPEHKGKFFNNQGVWVGGWWIR